MNIQLLKRLYSIYSPSGKEQKMVKFLCSYIRQLPGNISVSKDKFGNLYVVKGESESYPCLVSHIDQVSHCKHSKDFKAVETREVIFGYSPKNRRFENLGADDKNGVFICLECLKKYDAVKVVFFREEETGCRGSSETVMSFFDDVRFVIQPDRKGDSDLITSIGYSDLCSEKFMEAMEPEKWGYREENGLMTDVLALKEKGLEVSCINVSCGYYNAHTDEDIGKDLPEGGKHLLFGINHPILLSQHRPLGLNSHSLADKFLHLIFQMQPLYESAPHHSHHKPQNHIDDRHFGSKNPHQQHQTAQVHHGRGNEKGEGHPNRQSRSGKSHKERNGRTGTKGRHRPQKGRHQIGPHSPEPAQDLPASLRRDECGWDPCPRPRPCWLPSCAGWSAYCTRPRPHAP